MPITRETEYTEQVLRLLGSAERAGTLRPADLLPGLRRWPLSTTEAVRRRRSVRSFSTEPIDVTQLCTVIDAAQARHPGFSVLVAAYRISGLPPGAYLVESGSEPEPVPIPVPEHFLDDAREAYADAAALLIICGDLAAACAADGADGYSRLLVQAGAFALAAWLSAVSLGLAGSVYGRSHHGTDAVARTLGGQRHLFTAALGHEAVAERSASAMRRGNE